MSYTVEKWDWLDDWYVLQGGGGASVEGTLEEWKAIAAGIRAGENVAFRRVACQITPGGVDLWSPRNACGPNHYNGVSQEDLPALLASIDALEDPE